MARPLYLKQHMKEKQDEIRHAFAKPLGLIPEERTIEGLGLAKPVNTIFYVKSENQLVPFAFADVSWRSKPYDEFYADFRMSLRKRWAPIKKKAETSGLLTFLVLGFGCGSVRGWWVDPTRLIKVFKGGRWDRDDPEDEEDMAAFPIGWFKTPETLFREMGLL